VVNKSGPVRAIRSYIGANSGPDTQREHVFYARRQDVRTFLRVHAIPSVLDFYDHSPDASGMTYYNSLNTGGVLIDGVPESPAPATGAVVWEMVEGAQGSVLTSHSLTTNVPGFTYTSYYLDDATPPVTQCTGDAFAYGSSGLFIFTAIPCTDPPGCTNFLRPVRTMYYGEPGLTVAEAQDLHAQAQAPLTFTVQPWLPDSDSDGAADLVDNCPALANPGQENSDSGPPPPAGSIGILGDGAGIDGDDETIPNGDQAGDACDGDHDNDGLPDSSDGPVLAGCGAFDGTPAGHASPSGGDVTTVDGTGLSRDTDDDQVLDGTECSAGTNPRAGSAADRTACAAYAGGAPGSDGDGDGLQDAWEVCKWGTAAADANSDDDAMGDCREAMDINGNGALTNGDAAFVTQAFFGIIGRDWIYDVNGNGALTNGDGTLVRQAFFAVNPCE
jgi:hypothetical protein